MNHKHRRRSESRDSSRRYSSDDRSVSRSSTPRRHRRSSSRGRRSYSRSSRYSSKDSRGRSSSYSNDGHYKDRKNRFSSPLDKNTNEKKQIKDPSASSPKLQSKPRARNMAWTLPRMKEGSNNHARNVGGQRRKALRNFKPRKTFDSSANKSVLVDYKYESDEFKIQKENQAKVLKEKEELNKENHRLLAEYTQELNQIAQINDDSQTLVGNLSRLSKDSKEYQESTEKIQALKKAMKDLIPEEKPATRHKLKTFSKPTLEPNIKLDNRETRVFFSSLPECAKGKGNLAKWISENSKVLVPKEIAMLASQGDSYEAAVIQYKTHETAQKVLSSCKLHGISACWLPSTEPETSRSDDQFSADSFRTKDTTSETTADSTTEIPNFYVLPSFLCCLRHNTRMMFIV
ncbi:conserved hypothetical protein [Theileria orientalis strain Shintoku]|uniref:Uncharacterized protein n=1 Tax=Theileria orientalis strain Shintoku TaxID=869250 RepID=J4CCK0_THEOR|nr:conserved hypothetical protein [Theileria orientalis strain Shintoku]BAM39527.1 conserved hypothetical protein [Theileria orientalis strain Shintoku]|eukprot:XP_009689828.1 conserved hypothetical protein [Theileria orientalis strain Shintoku]